MLEGMVGKLRHEPLQLLHPGSSKHKVLSGKAKETLCKYYETSTLRNLEEKHTQSHRESHPAIFCSASFNPSLSCEKVDECIAYIGAILRVHGQVEKVITAFESREVDLLQEARL